MHKILRFFRRCKFQKRKKSLEWVLNSKEKNVEVPYFYISLSIFMFGLSFAFVPLYQLFCKSTGYGGNVQENNDVSKLIRSGEWRKKQTEKEKKKRLIEINFTSQANMPWKFEPEQKKIIVEPGENVLAFYKAKNLTNKPIIGIAVYHVIPDEAGLYFNKIQCFCFEEQMLNPNEELDLPVLFFIDPDILKDARLTNLQKITLSYLFFESDSEIPKEYEHLYKAIPSKTNSKVQVV